MALVVESTAFSSDASGGTTRTVTMPSGLSAGDLLIVDIVSDQNPTHTPPAGEGFAELLTPAGGAYDPNAGNVLRKTMWWKEADGGEGASLDWTFGASEPFVACAYRISGWHGTTAPEAEQSDNGGVTTTTPDPPSITPSWGSGDEETLFIASFGFDNGNRTFSGTYPTNYTNGAGQIATGTGGCGLYRAWRLATTATENPSTFQSLSTADDVLVATIAVRPSAGVTESLAAVVNGAATVTAALSERGPQLASSSLGAAAVTAALGERVQLAAAAAGAGAATADLTGTDPPPEPLLATVAGVAAVTAGLTERGPLLAASSLGVATVEAALAERVQLQAESLGAGVATGNLTGTEQAVELLSAVVIGLATVEGNVTERVQLAAAAAGAAVVTADVTERLTLSASVLGAGVCTAALAERVGLAATIDCSSSVTANLSGTNEAPGRPTNLEYNVIWQFIRGRE